MAVIPFSVNVSLIMRIWRILFSLVMLVCVALPSAPREVYMADGFNYREKGRKEWALGKDPKTVNFPIILEKIDTDLYNLDIFYNGTNRYTLMGRGEERFDPEIEADIWEIPFVDGHRSVGTLKLYTFEDSVRMFFFIYDDIELLFYTHENLSSD